MHERMKTRDSHTVPCCYGRDFGSRSHGRDVSLVLRFHVWANQIGVAVLQSVCLQTGKL